MMGRLIRNIYNNLTLKNKMLILNAVVIVLSITFFAYFTNEISGETIMEKAKKSSTRELELINSNLNTMVRTIEDYSKVITTSDKLQEYLLDLYYKTNKEHEKINIVKVRPELSGIISSIISPNTQIIASSVFVDKQIIYSDIFVNDYSSQSIITEEFLNNAFQYQKPLWSDPLRLTLSDGNIENVFAIAKLVIDLNSGNKTGIIVLYVPEEDIAEIYTENSANVNDRYYIINAEGSIISSEDKSNLLNNIEDVIDIDSTQYKELVKNGRLIIQQKGKSFLLSVRNFDRLDWRIVSMNSLDEITKERLKVQKFILFAGLLCLLFTFVSSYLISYTVTKPIQKLSETMESIMKGNMNVRAEDNNNKDIGFLTRGFNNLMDMIQKLLKDIVAEQKIKQEFEFKLIQSQIKPHFLYNSLETIISLNKLDRNEESTLVAKSLASFYRLSLSKGNDIIKIGEEIQLIKDYLYIQKKRYSNYMDFSIDVEPKIIDFYIPKLTLQPLVENSIYHGLKYKNNKGKLGIHGYMQDQKVILVVFDDGIGIPEKKISMLLSELQTEQREDFGLGSVNRRIKLRYGNEYGLEIQSEVGSYTKVMVKIPLLKTKV